MNERLQTRLREIKSRSAIRSWQMRQLSHASGVWFRLGLLLATSRSAWAISDSDVQRLIDKGLDSHPVSAELEPAHTILVITEQDLRLLDSRREVPFSDCVRTLSVSAIALVPFEHTRSD